MVDLEILHKSAEIASAYPAGEVPEDCPMHEDKATRARESIQVKEKIRRGTEKKVKKPRRRAGKERDIQVNKKKAKESVDKNHTGESAETSEKSADVKRSWKKIASSALDVGSKAKGGLEAISKAASTVASSGASSLKTFTEKGAKTLRKQSEKGIKSAKSTGTSIKKSFQKVLSDLSADANPPVRICVTCGAPIRAGSLFCGKCGQKLTEKVVDEVKDQIKGKIEDAAVEKAQELLQEEKKLEPMDLKGMSINESSLSKNIKKALKLARIATMGELADRVSKNPDELEDIKGIGPTAIKRIREEIEPIIVTKPAIRAEKISTCENCGEDLKPEWAFCPYCNHPIQSKCRTCGAKMEPDWQYCPMCNTKIHV